MVLYHNLALKTMIKSNFNGIIGY